MMQKMFDKLINKLHEMRYGYPKYYTVSELEKMNMGKVSLNTKLQSLGFKIIDVEKEKTIFGNIIGQDNIKKILESMINSVFKSNLPVSILLDGSAGCAKSMFLKDIEKFYRNESYYIDGAKATKAGIFDVLFEDEVNRIKFLIIDEIDKLNLNDQESLLTLIEDGRIIQTQKNGKKDKIYENLSVIAASNDKSNMLYPLLTRFYKIKIKDYTIEEFKTISRKVLLEEYKIDEGIIEYIIQRILDTKKRPNIRDIKQIAKLCNNDIEMVDLLIENSE